MDWSSYVCSSDPPNHLYGPAAPLCRKLIVAAHEIRGWLIAQSFPASAEWLKDRGHAQCPGPHGFACKSHQHPGTQAPLFVKRSLHVANDPIYIVPIQIGKAYCKKRVCENV